MATLERGQGTVRALLWEVAAADWVELDRCEGHPHFYRRERLAEIPGKPWIYRMLPQHGPVSPSHDYLTQIVSAHRLRGWDPSGWEQAARGLPAGRVFVYGSLRRGAENHGWMRGARWVGPVRTAPAYALLEGLRWPAMVSGEASVEGELWEVDAAHKARLDAFEGHPDLYRRSVIRLSDGATAEAWLWAGDGGVTPQGRLA